MSYLDRYKKRIQARGSSESDARLNNTIDILNRRFKDDPSYKSVLINNVLTDVRMINGNGSSNAELILRPGAVVNIGDYVVDNDDTWLVVDFVDHMISPKAYIKQCTNHLKWKLADGTIKTYKCIVSTGTFTIKDDVKFDIDLPEGQVILITQNNLDTLGINLDYRFIIGNQVYKITGKDDISMVGLLRFTAKIDTKNSNDDFTNGIAYNATTPDTGGGFRW